MAVGAMVAAGSRFPPASIGAIMGHENPGHQTRDHSRAREAGFAITGCLSSDYAPENSKRGADVGPDFNGDRQPVGGMGYILIEP
jgi:hypothetical protein